MISPFTGKEMTVRREIREMTFRKEKFNIHFHSWKCEDTGEEFEDTVFEKLNYDQVVNQYREKYNIPYPDEIKVIRDMYGLSASRMSQVLGFGVNTYRQYEAGEVPSEANARLIQSASDPEQFIKLIKYAHLDSAFSDTIEKVSKKMLGQKDNPQSKIVNYLFEETPRGRFTGFSRAYFEKFTEMVLFFCSIQPVWKTKLNKLLFYSDFGQFKYHGYSISGSDYRAINMGPVPDNFNSIFEYLVKENILSVEYYTFPDGGIGEKYTALRKPNPALFSDEEKEILSLVNQKFDTTKTQEIIRLSHQEKAWIENAANTNQPIDYFYAFDLLHI